MVKIILVLVMAFTLPTVVTAEVYFSDGFETGAIGEDPTYTDPVSGAGWTGDNLTEVVVENGVTPRTGVRMLKFSWDGQQPDQYFQLGSQQTGDVYVRYYVYYPDGNEDGENAYVHRDSGGGNNNKMFRLWGNDYTNRNKVGASSDDTLLGAVEIQYVEGAVIGDRVLDCDVAAGLGKIKVDGDQLPETTLESAQLGTWIAYEYHMRIDSGTGDGVIEMYVDGVLVAGGSDLSWVDAPCDPGYFLNGYIFGAANSGFALPTNIYIDDVVFSSTYIGLAGGELSNKITGSALLQ